VEPKFVSSDGQPGEGGSSGIDSALVGKPAPEFELEKLDGEMFRLAASRGKIVVLEFWASWCGPCVVSLPQVDQVSRDYADRGVKFVAINMEESKEAAAGMLERHKLQLPVALDRDGAVAAKYRVTVIPQTVVIDPEGKVARHFIGGGPRLGEELAEALRAILDGDSKEEPAKEGPEGPNRS
jgi:peroxiredoxin